MSNVTITKSSPADYADNPQTDTRRENLDHATDYRPVVHSRDWRYTAVHYAGSAGLIVVVTLLGGIFYFFRCGAPWLDYSATCEQWSIALSYAPYAIVGIGLIYAAYRLIFCVKIAQVTLEQRRIENARFSLLPDRFGNPTPADLYADMSPADRFESYFKLLELASQVKVQTAPHEWLPGSVNNVNITGPSYKNELVDSEPIEAPIAPALPAPQAGESILATLRREGLICRSNNSLHIGSALDGSGPRYLEIKHWGMLAHGGKGRTGKTSWTVYLACQMHMMGWQLVIADKHAYKTDGLLRQIEPLAESFLIEPATTAEATRKAIYDVARIGAHRLQQLQHDPDATAQHTPIVLIIDEFTNMVLQEWIDQDTLNTLIRITNEYAGLNIHGIINGHDWSAQMIGKERGAVMRRVTTHRVAHKMDAKGAEYLLPSGHSRMAELLKPGELVYVDDEGASMCTAPFITAHDVEYAADNRGQARPVRVSAKRTAMQDAMLSAMLASPPHTNGHTVAQSASGLSGDLRTSAKMPVFNETQQTDSRQTADRHEWSKEKKIAVLRALRSQGVKRDDARAKFNALGQGFDNDHWLQAGK